MNPENHCRLEGVVQSCPMYDDNWTRYNRFQRGQVRFWLEVHREHGGADIFLCAIEPIDAAELRHYENEIRAGRLVRLTAQAKAEQPPEVPEERRCGVIFVAESCGFDGHEAQPVHHRHRLTGKMAAAGDDSGEFPFQRPEREPVQFSGARRINP